MIRVLSPAKINLYLSVIKKRPDGYHDIVSLMQRISLYDEMIFRPHPQGIVIRCSDRHLPVDEKNIVFQAAKILFEQQGYSGGIQVDLTKNIPIAAGLGGGSSNAATALMTINEMFEFCLTRDELMGIGAKLGADVPFFIFGKTAWAYGVGDILTAADNIPSLWYVLINPGFLVSTKSVYENLNLRLTKDALNYTIPRIERDRDLLDFLRNDLESVTVRLFPEIENVKSILKKLGALGTLMSGSGPTVFGIFQEEAAAQSAIMALRGNSPAGWRFFKARSL